MNYIKFLRLKTGEDIISFCIPNGKTLMLKYPLNMIISYNRKIDKQELQLAYWLPASILEKNEAELSISDVLFSSDPNDSFKEYYLNFLNDSNIEEESNSEEEDINFKVLLESLDAKNIGKIH